ncbi:unnamed protein product, partial [Ectocarpus sp. 12 AP-2014]
LASSLRDNRHKNKTNQRAVLSTGHLTQPTPCDRRPLSRLRWRNLRYGTPPSPRSDPPTKNPRHASCWNRTYVAAPPQRNKRDGTCKQTHLFFATERDAKRPFLSTQHPPPSLLPSIK